MIMNWRCGWRCWHFWGALSFCFGEHSSSKICLRFPLLAIWCYGVWAGRQSTVFSTLVSRVQAIIMTNIIYIGHLGWVVFGFSIVIYSFFVHCQLHAVPCYIFRMEVTIQPTGSIRMLTSCPEGWNYLAFFSVTELSFLNPYIVIFLQLFLLILIRGLLKLCVFLLLLFCF